MENKTFKRLKARKRQVEKLSRDAKKDYRPRRSRFIDDEAIEEDYSIMQPLQDILGSHETVTPSPPDDRAPHSRSHEIDDEAMEEHDSPPPPPPDTIGSQWTILPVLNDHVPFVDMGKSRQKEKRAHRRKTLREKKIIEGQIVVKTTDGGQPRGDHGERFVQRFRNLVASRVELTVSNVKSCPRVEIDAVKQGLEASYDCKYVEKYFKDKFSHVFRNLRHEKMRERNSANRAKFMRSLHVGRTGYVGLKDDMEKELGREPSAKELFICAHTFKGSKNHKELNEFAKEKMQSLEKTAGDETIVPLDAYFGNVNRGRVPGCGLGAALPDRRHRSNYVSMEEVDKLVDARLNSQVEAKVELKIKELQESLIRMEVEILRMTQTTP